MHADFLLEVFRKNQPAKALVWNRKSYSYEWLLKQIQDWEKKLDQEKVKPGTVVALEADFSPNAVALFLALMNRNAVLVPLTKSVEAKKPEFLEISQAELMISIDEKDSISWTRLERTADHEFYKMLQAKGHPGLVLFSSGSTGKSKAAVHDLTGILDKFKIQKRSFRTITFLLYDHIGGVNTMLYTLSNAGCMVTVPQRTPDEVLRAVEEHQVELLPTSPTFINLILLSEAYKRYSLQSLKTVTYGTEPMPESTLRQFHQLFPEIRLQQTYGLSEVGILRSQSKSSDSLWVKVGGEGFETRVIDGMLQIKAQSAMLGYLNAPSPFTEDGWFLTGDSVEVDGEYLRILGRKSELINVGGEKVYPAEVESVILELDNIQDVTVFAEKNPIMGNIVCAKVFLKQEEDLKQLGNRIKSHCRSRLQPYKVPIKISVQNEKQHSERFKKTRVKS